MISLLKGSLFEIDPPLITLEVSGVGYEIAMPLSHLLALPGLGAAISLYTHQSIREDAHLLFGFNHKSERDCFRQLIKVSGIGPKIALALLSTLNSSEITQAISSNEIDTLCLTPGIGKKMAERMVLELKGKLSISTDIFNPPEANSNTNHALRKDIGHALESLGYTIKEINQVLSELEPAETLSQGIKEALKFLGKH